MEKKLVWIVSHYGGAPSFSQRLPEYLIAKALQNEGYDVKLIVSSFVHNTDINFIKDNRKFIEKNIDGVDFIFIKTREYGSKINRVLNMLEFSRGLKKLHKKLNNKPDLIISQMPTPNQCYVSQRLAKKFNVPYITYIVDLWPLSIVEYAGISNSNPIIQLLYKFEKWIYRKSDDLVFTWEGAYDYIIDKGWDNQVSREKFNYINIGVDLNQFNYNKDNFTVEDSDLEDDTFKVMYCGSVRQANDIGTVVECAKKVNEKGYEDKIKFIIYGDGPDKAILEEKCKKENITNVLFKGSINKNYIPFVLTKSNLNILNLKKAATQKYGNSSNKLFEYFAAGNPVLANIDEGNYPIISKYNAGKIVEAGNIDEYAEKVLYFYNLTEREKLQYSNNAIKAAKDFDTTELNKNWIKLVDKYLK
ncbi:glycosyltransferase family 4 protein [Helcococcus bovis]|uniref:glycosyltransferase family 4 protein n=1 Tax=Helcococcus bovis TaxID=3153252 RepID=UPI0038B8F1E5